MQNFIYTSIVDKLSEMKNDSGQAIIKHFGIWNNSVLQSFESAPFSTPAIFIEFAPIEWQHRGNRIREAAVDTALHIIIKPEDISNSNEVLGFFDFLTKINISLLGYYNKNEKFAFDAFSSKKSVSDYDSVQLWHNIETFTCNAIDYTAKPIYEMKTGMQAGININFTR